MDIIDFAVLTFQCTMNELSDSDSSVLKQVETYGCVELRPYSMSNVHGPLMSLPFPIPRDIHTGDPQFSDQQANIALILELITCS
jgi:hypothetical protein